MTDSSSSTSFTKRVTVITAAWLNHINKLAHTVFASAETKAEARTALDLHNSSTDHSVPRHDGTSGKLQDSGVTVDDSDNVDVPGTLTVDGASTLTGNVSVGGTVDGRDIATDGTKLDGIESGATADQTNAEIETAYNTQVAVVGQAEAEAGTATTVRRWTAQRVKQAIDALGGGSSVLSAKSSNYTLQSGDLDAVLVVPIDISSGSVTITELALGSMSGVVRYVVVNDAGQSSANKAVINDSGASEVATMFQQGEEYVMAYDGTSRRILSGDRPCPAARVVVAKTADQSVTASTTANALDANVTEQIDQGSNFASGAYTAPWAGRCRITSLLMDTRGSLNVNYSIGGTSQLDWTATEGSGSNAGGSDLPLEFDVSSGDAIRPQVHNSDTNNASTLFGDAAEDESLFIIEMIERHR